MTDRSLEEVEGFSDEDWRALPTSELVEFLADVRVVHGRRPVHGTRLEAVAARAAAELDERVPPRSRSA